MNFPKKILLFALPLFTSCGTGEPLEPDTEDEEVALDVGTFESMAGGVPSHLRHQHRRYPLLLGESLQLGTGATTDSAVPVAVAGGITFTSVSGGFGHMCGITTSGAAYCWGENENGELGDNTATNRSSPVLVLGQ